VNRFLKNMEDILKLCENILKDLNTKNILKKLAKLTFSKPNQILNDYRSRIMYEVVILQMHVNEYKRNDKIKSESGSKFWECHFKQTFEVRFSLFLKALESELSAKIPFSISANQQSALSFFLDFKGDGYVSVYEFSAFMDWFGPFNINGDNCVQRATFFYNNPWFVGFVSSSLALDEVLGTYMVRISPVHKCLTLSIKESDNKIISHFKIGNEEGKYFIEKETSPQYSIENVFESFKSHAKRPFIRDTFSEIISEGKSEKVLTQFENESTSLTLNTDST